MSNRKVTMEDTEKVHVHIEECLTRYMTKNETEKALLTQYNIEPCFTDIIWKRMEDENQAFFKEYYKRLALKEQIIEFNRLLSQQAILISRQGSLNDVSIVADNRHKMPASGIAENTGMTPDAQTVTDWFKKCSSYMNPWVEKAVGSYSHDRNTNGFRGLSLDGHGSRKESLAHPEISGYLPFATDAHNNSTPSPPAIYNPSSSRMGGNSRYANGTWNMLHEVAPVERNSWDSYNADFPQDMSNLPPSLNYIGERQSQDNAGSVWCQQNFRFRDSGSGRSNH